MSRGQRAQHEVLFQGADLRTALIYYAESHCGQMPDSPEEFLKLPYVTRNSDGTLQVRSNERSEYAKVYGWPIKAGWESLVRWGSRPTEPSDAGDESLSDLTSDGWLLKPLNDSEFAKEQAVYYSEELRQTCKEFRDSCTPAVGRSAEGGS